MENTRSAQGQSITLESYPILDAGVYRARVVDIEEAEFQFGPSLIFKWMAVGGEWDGTGFDGLCSKRLTPKSKLHRWALAHLGMSAFPEGYALEINALIGKEVLITLSVGPRADGSGERNIVDAVSPIRTTPRRAPVVAAPAAARVAAPWTTGEEAGNDEIPF